MHNNPKRCCFYHRVQGAKELGGQELGVLEQDQRALFPTGSRVGWWMLRYAVSPWDHHAGMNMSYWCWPFFP